jgi:acyl-coenzyme A synthetase/AMP-(fatty) acid ligase
MALPASALVARPGTDALAAFDGRLVTVDEFLGHANGLAKRLPAAVPVINLCENRYLFLIAFAAALLRGGYSLLPPDPLAATLQGLRERYPGCVACTDSAANNALADVISVLPLVSGESRNPQLDAQIVAATLFTSGSTGPPVPQIKTWGALVTGAHINRPYYLGAGNGPWSIVATVPAQHMYGLETSIFSALCGPAVMSDARPFFPADIRSALEAVPAPRVLVSTPVHLRALLRSDVQLPTVARVLSATAPLDVVLARDLEIQLGCQVIEIYGTTETGSMAWRRTAVDSPWQFFSGFTPQHTTEYTQVSARHLVEPVTLADILEFAPEGAFRLAGRRGDIVKVGGKRTTIASITQHLLQIDGVDDAVVLQQDNAGTDGRVAALVVSSKLDLQSIRLALSDRLDSVFVPRPMHVVPALPRSATGKLSQRAVADLLAKLNEQGRDA